MQKQQVAEGQKFGCLHTGPFAGRLVHELCHLWGKNAFSVVLAVSLAFDGPAFLTMKETYQYSIHMQLL